MTFKISFEFQANEEVAKKVLKKIEQSFISIRKAEKITNYSVSKDRINKPPNTFE